MSTRAEKHVSGEADALTNRTIAHLREFTDWLDGSTGFIGEVGWPSNQRQCIHNGRRVRANDEWKWNALGERYFQECDRHKLWVTVQSADERIRSAYFSIYVPAPGKRAVSGPGPGPQYRVLEKHLGLSRDQPYRRGINFSGGQNIKPDVFWHRNPGHFNEQVPGGYWYPGVVKDGPGGRSSFDYLRSRGYDVVRLGLRWERMQPKLGGPISDREWQRYRATLRAADEAGLKVIADLHNYAWYYGPGPGKKWKLGTSQLSQARFVDFWEKFSRQIRQDGTSDQAVIAYDVMNEPANAQLAPNLWETLSRAVVNSIRESGDEKRIIVPLVGPAGEASPRGHPTKWLSDPGVIWTEHQYFDTAALGAGGGRYDHHYDDENRYWAQHGH